jgi:magnesium transporter
MKSERSLFNAFLESHPGDAARILERFPAGEIAGVLERTEPSVAAEVVERMDPVSAARFLEGAGRDLAAAVVAALPVHEAARLFRVMASESCNLLLESLPAEVANPLRTLLRYPEDTAGALMEPGVMPLPADLTVGEAWIRLRRSPRYVITYLYVVDRSQVLVGVLSLRELLRAKARDPLRRVMRSPVTHLTARSRRADIVEHPGWKNFYKLPVTDDSGALIGVIGYKAFRHLESRHAPRELGQTVLETALSFGELFWVGLSAGVESLTAVAGLLGGRPDNGKETPREP